MSRQLSQDEIDRLLSHREQLESMGLLSELEDGNTVLNMDPEKLFKEGRDDTAITVSSVPVTKVESEMEKKIVSTNQVVKEVAYETFLEIAGLPSQGEFYKETLKGQALKVEDLLLVMTIDESNVFDRLNEILTRRIRGVDPLDILSMDERYILFWLRASSYPDVDFKSNGFVCDHCKYDFKSKNYGFGFGSLSFEPTMTNDEIRAFYNKDGAHEWKTSDGRLVRIYPQTRRNEYNVNRVLQSEFYSKGLLPSTELSYIYDISSVVDFGYGIDDVKSNFGVLKQLSAMDFINLSKLVGDTAVNTTPCVTHKCPKCGEDTLERDYPFRLDYYVPVSF